jgi:hypothetical protein
MKLTGLWCTPMTSNGCPSTVIILPTGSMSPNRRSAILSFTITTREALRASAVVKLRPGVMSPPSTSVHAGV